MHAAPHAAAWKSARAIAGSLSSSARPRSSSSNLEFGASRKPRSNKTTAPSASSLASRRLPRSSNHHAASARQAPASATSTTAAASTAMRTFLDIAKRLGVRRCLTPSCSVADAGARPLELDCEVDVLAVLVPVVGRHLGIFILVVREEEVDRRVRVRDVVQYARVQRRLLLTDRLVERVERFAAPRLVDVGDVRGQGRRDRERKRAAAAS